MEKRIVVMFLVVAIGLAGSAGAQMWDLNADFANAFPTANAFGTWSLGFSLGSSHLPPLHADGFVPAAYGRDLNGLELIEDVRPNDVLPEGTVPTDWTSPRGAGFITFNDSGAPWVWDEWGTATLAAGMTGLRTSDAVHSAKVRWTSPVAMTVHLEGAFYSGHDSILSLLSIEKNDEIEDEELLGNIVTAVDAPFSIDIDVAIGDTIDFVLRESSDPGYSLNGLDVVITPEPVTMTLLGLGAVAALRRRRK